MMSQSPSYHGYRFPPDIINHAVWLYQLIDGSRSPGYEPTALGMSTARPFVTTFTSVNDLAGFARLARAVRVRA